MARRKSTISPAGKRLLRGPRRSVRKRRRAQVITPQPQPLMVDGRQMNAPEASLYRAAMQMHYAGVEAHGQRGPVKALGGADADLVFHNHRAIVEVQGPFHFNLPGRVRDFWRTVNRKRLWPGYRIEQCHWQIALSKPHTWLRSHVGPP